MYLDLIVMQCAHRIRNSSAVTSPDGSASASIFTDDAASAKGVNSLLEVANASLVTAEQSQSVPPANDTVAGTAVAHIPRAEEARGRGSETEEDSEVMNTFQALLNAVATVQPLAVTAHPKKLELKVEIPVGDNISSRCGENMWNELDEAVRQTLASGICGTANQHPSRTSTNKYAPHFSVNHEICLRVNMR